MNEELSITTVVRCLGALLLVLGGTTAIGACLMGQAALPRRQERVFALAVIVPVGGLLAVAVALRSLS